jgi:DNA primase
MNGFKAVKEAVPVEDYARTLTELKPNGRRLAASCPIPGHNDRTPSFHIWPSEAGGSWYCFGACGRGGDVIDLCRAVEGGQYWEAMMILATCCGVRLPEKPPGWFGRQARQRPVRIALEEMRVARIQRRLMRWMVASEIAGIADPDERLAEATLVWEGILPVAQTMVAHLREDAW